MKSTRIIVLLLLTLVLLPSCGLPSFEDQFGDAGVSGDMVDGTNALTIAFAEAPQDYSPLNYEAVTRKYINNIYEPLVSFDKNFNKKSSLALSWGRLDDLTWDFKLRQGVLFHDGSEFDASDAVFSIEQAMKNETSGLKNLLSGIVSVEKTEDYRFQIVTAKPDPLLVNRLTNVYIFPLNYTKFASPVGTGPYVAAEFGSDYLKLGRFDGYWGDPAYFSEVYLRYLPDPDDRLDETLNGGIDILANVPPQYADYFGEEDFNIQNFPSLEVSFLMLNVGGVLVDDSLRSAVWNAISGDYADRLGGGFLSPARQYAAQGITGFLTGFPGRRQDYKLASNFREMYEGDVTLSLDLPEGLESLGDEIISDLQNIDVVVDVTYFPPDEYENHVLEGNSDLYFFGWRYDLADVSDFFESVAHTKTDEYGLYNGINFSNDNVDSLVEEASTSMDTGTRGAVLEKLTNAVADEYVIMPLFESRSFYISCSGIYWDLRLDGQILASEIFEIMVK